MRLYKRNNTFYVEIRRGVHRSLKTSDEKTAKSIVKAIEREHLRNEIAQLETADKAMMTVEGFAVEYLAARGDKSGDTTRMDKLALKTLAEHLGAGTPIKSLCVKSIELFKKVLLSKKLSPFSINTYLRHIRAALRVAADWGYIDTPPQIKPVKTPRPLPRVLSVNELETILKAAHDTYPELGAVIGFAVWTGCRLSEILNAKWEHANGDSIRITGKGDKTRVIPLLPGAMDAMGERKESGPIFRQNHPDTVSHWFKDICVRCGLHDVHFHTLRHSAATQMVSSGIKLEVIQKILGHCDIRTTQIYAQIVDRVMVDEMRKLRW